MNDWLEKAASHRDAGQMGEAIEVLERAVAEGDESPEICKELARLSLTVNEVRAFANWCHEAMRLDGADPEPHLMISRVLVANGRWEEAVESLTAALKRNIPSAADRAEAEQLLGQAEAEQARFRRRNLGFSNI